jgi:hypothetical protein
MSFGINFDAEPTSTLSVTCVHLLPDALKASPDARDALRINLFRLRLTRWGESVNIMKDSTFTEKGADAEEVNDIRKVLIKLAGRFERWHVSDDDAAREQSKLPQLPQPSWLRHPVFMEFERSRSRDVRIWGFLLCVGQSCSLEHVPRTDRCGTKSRLASTKWTNSSRSYLPGPACANCAQWTGWVPGGGGMLRTLGQHAVGIDPWLWSDIRDMGFLLDAEYLTY